MHLSLSREYFGLRDYFTMAILLGVSGGFFVRDDTKEGLTIMAGRMIFSKWGLVILLLTALIVYSLPEEALARKNTSAITQSSLDDEKDRIYSDSLWGNLLLNMAYQRDPLLKKFIRKRNMLGPAIFASTLGIFTLNTVIGAYTMGQAWQSTLLPPNQPGGRHLLVTPNAMVVAAGAMGLLTLGGSTFWFLHYDRKIKERQVFLRKSIDALLVKLNHEGETPEIRETLGAFVGQQATDEFLRIFKVVQPATL